MKKSIFYFVIALSVLASCSKDDDLNTLTNDETISSNQTVNENVIILDSENAADITYDATSGSIAFSYDSIVDENNILVVDLDTAGLIRKVNSVTYSSGTYFCETEQATLTEVFSNAEFKLSTKVISPSTSLKSTMSNKEISEALTDDNNYIHPVSVIYKTKDGQTLKSAISGEWGEDMYTKIDFSDLELYSDSYASIYISEGYVSLAPCFKFNFDFEDCDLQTFKFWSDSTEFEIKTVLATEVSAEYTFSVEEELYSDIISISFEFLAGTVPVYIDFDCDLYGGYELSTSAEASATTGFKSTRYTTLGIEYTDDEWSTFSSYDKADTIYSIELNADANLTQRVEIFPRFSVELYDIIGIYTDIIPYVYNENNVNLATTAWDSQIDLGMDARIGTNSSIFGITLFDYSTDKLNIFEFDLWNSPDTLLITSGNNQTGSVNEQLSEPIELLVTDNLGLPAPLVRLDLEITAGDGSFENSTIWTDENGLAEIYWTMGSETGTNTATATILKADDSDISGSPIVLTATAN